MIKFFCTFCLAFPFNNIYSQDTTYARSIIKELTSSKFLGRGYVNNGVNKSAKFLVNEFKSIGLLPIGKSYSQYYKFDVNTFPKSISVIINEKKLQAGKHFLIDPTSQSSHINCPLIKRDSLNYRAVENDNKVLIEVKLQKKLTYSVGTHLQNTPVLFLLKDSFPSELKHINIAFKNKFIKNFKSQNLCGYIRGTQEPDSFLVFSAHYDHLGAMGKTAYFPGANDNASGVSMLLNLAKYYQKNPAKYSVVFLLFSGEEAGLLGSKYFSEHPLFSLSKIKFLTNLDLLGTGDDGMMVVNATVYKSQFEKLNTINLNKKYVAQLKQRGKAANSDHYWFSEKGVPCFFIYTMGGISAYHDINDIEKTLPLTDYIDVCKLLIDFSSAL